MNHRKIFLMTSEDNINSNFTIYSSSFHFISLRMLMMLLQIIKISLVMNAKEFYHKLFEVSLQKM